MVDSRTKPIKKVWFRNESIKSESPSGVRLPALGRTIEGSMRTGRYPRMFPELIVFGAVAQLVERRLCKP